MEPTHTAVGVFAWIVAIIAVGMLALSVWIFVQNHIDELTGRMRNENSQLQVELAQMKLRLDKAERKLLLVEAALTGEDWSEIEGPH